MVRVQSVAAGCSSISITNPAARFSQKDEHRLAAQHPSIRLPPMARLCIGAAGPPLHQQGSP
eukprot:scaffold22325_cov21-Tisochrysis_lutea.AAC.1